jgi:ATP-dependent exoDNAse (exonuclease V) beta subunit
MNQMNNSPMGNNFAILASAGTGKTYQLSVRIARLLMLDKVKPNEIIALTFTRAAAAEFYLRTLERLRDAATDKAKHLGICGDASAEGVDQGNPLVLDPKVHTQEKFAAKLRELVLHADQLTLGTLDSFFARLVNQFALELGLETSKPATVSEQQAPALIERAVSVLFDKLEAEGKLGDLGAELTAFSDGKSMANPTEILLGMAKANHDMLTLAPHRQTWGNKEAIWPNGAPAELKVDAPSQLVEADLQKVLTALGRYPLSKSADSENPAYRRDQLTNGFEEVARCTKISAIDPAKFGGFLDKYAAALKHEEPQPFEVKYYSEKVLLSSEELQALRSVVWHLFSMATRSAILRTQALYACLTHFEEAYDRTNRRKGLLSFNDYVTLLSRWPSRPEGDTDEAHQQRIHEAIEEIQFRLDSGLKHWLLDEFQDTGTRQFDVLSRNVDEILQDNEDRSLFVVGDAKQSLYEWRSGNRKLLANLNESIKANGISAELNETRRCSPQVLKMVNSLLSGLETRDLGKYFSKLAAKDWDKNFREQRAHPMAPQTGQAVWVRIMDRIRVDNDPVGTQAEWITGDLERSGVLEAKKGKKTRRLRNGVTCAILVSNNDHAAQIAEQLRSNKIEATDENSVPVVRDNPVTAGLFAILEVTAHPDNGLARGLAWMSPAARPLILGEDGKPAWGKLCRKVADKFVAHGAEAVVDWLASSVKLGEEDEFSAKRLRQFRTIAAEYDLTEQRELEGFIQFAENSHQRDSADSRSVQVLTIHRSKGLEYDLVYLPCLNDQYHKMANVRGNMLYMTPSMAGDLAENPAEAQSLYDERLFRPNWLLAGMNPKVARQIPPLSQALEAIEAEGAYGALCKLYVGMTRAKYRLVMISNILSEKKLKTKQISPKDAEPKVFEITDTHFEHPDNHGGHDFACFLESALRNKAGGEVNCPGDVKSLYAWHDTADTESTAWAEACMASHLAKAKPAPQRRLVQPKVPFKAVIRPDKKKPSNHETTNFFQQQKADGAPAGGKRLGTYVHELFALLGTDLAAFEQKLAKFAVKPGDETTHAAALERIRSCLEDQSIIKLLIEDALGKVLWVERKAVVYDREHDVVTPAVFDRVYIVPGKSALIIDYKTAGNGSDESLKKAYESQMTNYREAIAKLTGLSPDKISCKLIGIFKSRVSVVDVF